MAKGVWLGVDLGTSSLKAGLAGEDGRLLAQASVPLARATPRPGWSEQDSRDWILALEQVLAGFAAGPGLGAVRAIGLSGQMHATIPLDGADAPLRHAMLWNDGRAESEARALGEATPPAVVERLGVAASPGFPAAKLAWLARHEPAVLAATRYLPGAKDLLLLHLTGERATDPSEAAGTWLFDNQALGWEPRVLGHLGLDASLLSRIVPSGAQAGRVRAALAARFGLQESVVVAAGAGDTPAVGLGLGAVRAGTGFVQLGTSAQLFVATDLHAPAIAPLVHAFAHARPGLWYAMAAMLNGASALASIAGLAGLGPDAFAALAAEAPDRPTGLLVLPYLTGERTPHDDARARGVVFGLGADTSRAELARAVLEGVAFTFADAAEALAAGGTALPATLGFAGGGSRDALWGRMIASILDRPLVRVEDDGLAALMGAIRLARIAGGEPEDAVLAAPSPAGTIAPDAALARAYAPRIEAFRDLYRRLRPAFAARGAV